jgi:predicted dehydrogenase
MPTRRSFLRRSARALAVAAIAPQIVPSGVLSLHGQPGANGRLVTGHIGLGPRGRELLRRFKDVGALCDVDQRRLAKARTQLPEATASTLAVQDYRRVLERKDIDAVVIATPDHWHALMAIEACQAGKHVYLETPLARSLEEGHRLQRVVADTKRCVQVGGQGRSNPLGFAACQVIRAGRLGDIQRIECWHPPDLRPPPPAPQPPPKELDWDLWLGPLKEREFDEQLFAGAWRLDPDIGGGELNGRGFHVFGLMTWFLPLDPQRVRKVTFQRLPADESKPEFAPGCEVRFELVDPALEIVWAQPGVNLGNTEYGAKYFGTKDSGVVESGERGVGASRNITPYISKEIEPSVERSKDQIDNWRAAIRTGRPPIFPVADGLRALVFTRLAALAEKQGGELRLEPDAAGAEFPKAVLKADALHYRSPWRLPGGARVFPGACGA